MTGLIVAASSFLFTRHLSRPGTSRKRFEHLQRKALRKWLKQDLPKVSAFDLSPERFGDLPVMDKATLMADFASFNTRGITTDQVRAAMEADCLIGDLTVGASTGTSGNRGLFVISEVERFRWLGSIVAKTIADLLWQRQRVAIILPQGTGLYQSANKIRQVQLSFFDLVSGFANLQPQLERFDPTVIVAPPKVLRHMAEQEFSLRPQRVFSAAETLDPIDRPVIEGFFQMPLHQIYMATEGLLGTTCRHGRLHLAEDSVAFEFEPVGGGLVSPLISSFRRSTQILARYRMNDLLRLSPDQCPCGSPLQPVAEVIGRMDDCFLLSGVKGPEMVTPDVLRNAVLDADSRITDYRIVQTGPDNIALILQPGLSTDARQAACFALARLLERRQIGATVNATLAPMNVDPARKLRRVERRYNPDRGPS